MTAGRDSPRSVKARRRRLRRRSSSSVPRMLRGRFSSLKGASRFLRKWPSATLDLGDLGGPWSRKSGQAQACPAKGARHAQPAVAGACGHQATS